MDTYTVISENFVEPLGFTITSDELEALGANVPALLEAGHLSEPLPQQNQKEQ